VKRLSLILSSGLGLGYLPKAPGTFGTLWGVLLFYLSRSLNPWVMALGTLIFIGLAILLSEGAERALGTHDSSAIVIDEVAGYLVAVLGLTFDFWVAVLAFALFRLFDIWKPWPIRQVDRGVSGGLGVVLDDVLAGVYANLVVRGVLWAWGYFHLTLF